MLPTAVTRPLYHVIAVGPDFAFIGLHVNMEVHMKNILTVLLFSSALLTTGSVHAQPSTDSATTAATTTIPSSDISTLHGELVPVGDQNKYRYSYRRYNISVNPLAMMLGWYQGSASYAIHANLAIRGDVTYFRPVGSDNEGIQIGVGLPVYFKKVYSGLFIEPGFVVRNIDESVAGPQVLAGYHWIWDSGFNVSAATGLGRDISTGGNDQIFVNGYLQAGYAF